MSRNNRFSAAIALIAVFFINTAVFAQFKDLVRRVPGEANTLVFIDVDQLHKSALGQKENWQASHEQAFQAGLVMVPPQASEYLAAAKIDVATMQPEWEIAVTRLKYEPTIAKVALRFQGTVDNIGGRDVAVLPGDMYVVKFGPTIAGVGFPAVRQDVARWLDKIDNNSLSSVSTYLQEAQSFAESGSPIIMAMDLTHAISAGEVRKRLNDVAIFKGKDVDLDEISEVLASIRGISLGITVSDKRTGAVKVDFAKDVSALKEFAKPLLLEALERHGAMINEFYDWDVQVGARHFQIQGTLYQSGTRRILSLLDSPLSLQDATKPVDPGTDESKQKLAVMASQQYFKSVQSLLDDLRDDKQDRKTLGQVGVWFGKYARLIDRLPMVNVDADLLDYGKFVSESLRQGQSSVQETAIDSRIGQQQVPEQYDVRTYSVPVGVNSSGVYGWSGWSAEPNLNRTGQLKAQVRTQVRIRGSLSANLILQHIDDATADIRRYMTQKYNVDF